MTIDRIKRMFYFPLASYFRFFAQILLRRWNPRIIVITGSSGKTTLLHLVQSQLKTKARYSHHANSSYGIPFHILGLERETLTTGEWIWLFFKTPFCAFKNPPKEKLYIVEADCDRPGEGKFLAEFLRPEATLWVSLSKTHSMNFDHLVEGGVFTTIEDAIAHEFAYFAQNAQKQLIINGDNPYITKQITQNTKHTTVITEKKYLQKYHVDKTCTTFTLQNRSYTFPHLLPKSNFYSLVMTITLLEYLNIALDPSFIHFVPPPGRSGLFQGIKNTTIVDSTYNASFESMKTILEMYAQIPYEDKWVILGDMREQGKEEKKEHEKLATLLTTTHYEQILLVGPAMNNYTYPALKKYNLLNTRIERFNNLALLISYIEKNLSGGTTLLFKASQGVFLETVLEHFLAHKKDVSKLPRRGSFWDKERKKLYIP